MALFSRTKKTEKPAKEKATPKASAAVPAFGAAVSHVLSNPRITEKATMAAQNSVYVFDVATTANKKQIMSAIESVYKVKPQKVAVINVRSKSVRNMRTGKYGTKGGGKKAYVYLKKGETITLA